MNSRISEPQIPPDIMEDFNSETDSDYTSYWRDWVSEVQFFCEKYRGACFHGRGMGLEEDHGHVGFAA